MVLIKTLFLSVTLTIIKVIAGLISIKIVAVYVGSTGLTLMGQFQNFINMMSGIASAGVNSGVIKYIA